MTFADKLQSLRKEKGLSQEDLAERCGISRQSVSKWETGLGYPETEKLLLLCDIFDVNLDELLRDKGSAPDRKTEALPTYEAFHGKWGKVFLKDREFHGFYCVALAEIRGSWLVFVDEKGRAILADSASVSTISELPKEKQKKAIPQNGTAADINDWFRGKMCDIKLKQAQSLFGFQKPGGFYSVVVESISDEAVTAHDLQGRQCTVKMADVLFVRESQGSSD